MASLLQPPPTTAALLCGYYGEGNLGDDALLAILLAELPKSCRPWIMARHASTVRSLSDSAHIIDRRSPVAILGSLQRVDVLILGGGSLIQDSTSLWSLTYYLTIIVAARCLGVRIILWAQGFGPLQQPLSRWLVCLVLPMILSATWRDHLSLKLAKQVLPHHSMISAPDPVWCIPSRQWFGGEDIVICWRPTAVLSSAGWDLLLDALSRLAISTGAKLHWLAFHEHQDAALPLILRNRRPELADLWARSQYSIAINLDKTMEKFSHSRLVLAMRLHALILSQLSGSPSVALSCDPKISAAANIALVPCIELQALPPVNKIVDQWLSLFDQAADLQHVQLIGKNSSVHGQFLRDVLSQLS